MTAGNEWMLCEELQARWDHGGRGGAARLGPDWGPIWALKASGEDDDEPVDLRPPRPEGSPAKKRQFREIFLWRIQNRQNPECCVYGFSVYHSFSNPWVLDKFTS